MDNCYECETLGRSVICPSCGGTGRTDKQQSVWRNCSECGTPTRRRVVVSRKPLCSGCAPKTVEVGLKAIW